jgi:hypothetical protein
MGLLDDAIREHLELRRRRGADPGEVAREEQEVLRPIDFGGEMPAWACGPASYDPYARAAVGQAEPLAEAGALQTPFDRGAGIVEQETVEVDMSALISHDDGTGAPDAEIRAGRITAPPVGLGLAEDFEWETPQPQRERASSEQRASRRSIAIE